MPLTSDKFRSVRLGLALGIISSVAFGFTGAIAAEKVLHAFQGSSDGDSPQAPLVMDASGNLYGTTSGGGGGTGCRGGSSGCGTVFEISGGGTETILHSFAGGSDGDDPLGGLLSDSQGNLYGTTEIGGGSTNCVYGCGTIFRLAQGGPETILYAFQGGSDGGAPEGSLIADANGDLFGETFGGGSYSGTLCAYDGCGTVFELKPDGTKVTLYTFQGGSDGGLPEGGLIADKSGNLYGTAFYGGDLTCGGIGGGDGCGVVFEVTPNGTENVLYAFQGEADGAQPRSALVMDSADNFYGTTDAGGNTQSCAAPDGCGVVFKLARDGTESALYAFYGGIDGDYPSAGLVMDKSGNLYGTTSFGGGGARCKKLGFNGCGIVFKVTPDGMETRLISFGGDRGKYPAAGLLLKNGNLYGTATQGGAYGDGTVFSLPR